MKKLYRSLILLGCFSILSVLFLPRIASTKIGHRFLIQLIEKSIGGDIQIENIQLSWFGPQKFSQIDYQNDLVTLKLDDCIFEMPLWSAYSCVMNPSSPKRHGHLEIQNGTIELQKEELSQTVFEHIYGKVDCTGTCSFLDLDFYARSKNTANVGKCDLHGKISPFRSFLFNRNYNNISCDIDIHLTRLPSRFLDYMFQFERKFCRTFCGTYTSLDGVISLDQGEGNLVCEVKSSNLKTQLSARVKHEGIFLNEDLDIAFHVDEELSTIFLKDFHPFFRSIIQTPSPTKLSIKSEGFFLPAENPSLLEIASASLDFGKVYCRNNGNLEKADGFMKDGSLFGASKMDVWFSPLLFSLKNGIMQMKKMDVLVEDSIHFFTYGAIDLYNQSLHMILELDDKSLKNAFDLFLFIQINDQI